MQTPDSKGQELRPSNLAVLNLARLGAGTWVKRGNIYGLRRDQTLTVGARSGNLCLKTKAVSPTSIRNEELEKRLCKS